MSGWFEGRISHTEQAARDLFRVHVDVKGTPLVGTHSLPGQYLKLRLDGFEAGVFAIASGPDEDGGSFELLVKRGSDLADALTDAKVGATVQLKAPEGPGFPLERGRGKSVLLFATGSGISAIRSAIQAIRKRRGEFKDVTLYFGARTPDAFAYEDEFSDWNDSGVQVVRTVSQPGHPGWEGLEGYVQQALPEARFTDAVAFVCGQPDMVTGVTEALVQRGMDASQIFQNV